MTMQRLTLILLLFVCMPAQLEAQFYFSPCAPAAPWFGGVRFSYVGRNFALNGGFGARFYPWGYPPFNPYFGFPGYGFPSPNVTVFYQPPPTMFNPPIVINQPVVVPPDRRSADDDDGEFIRIQPGRRRNLAEAPRRDQLRPEPEKPMPGVERGQFRPIDPKDRDAGKKDDAAPKPLPPGGQQITKSEVFVTWGKAAFFMQQYGRAERLLRSATEQNPRDSTSYFLLAEAQLALAKYQEATASILLGLQTRPDWPASQFRPEELYGENRVDFKDHLLRLEDTLARNPNDKDLLFLFGYEQWFLGRTKEALQLFERAQRAGIEPRWIDLFVKAKRAFPVVRK